MKRLEKLRISFFARTSSTQQKETETVGRQITVAQEFLAQNPDFQLVPRVAGATLDDPYQAFFIDEAYNLEEWDENTQFAELFRRVETGEIEAIMVSEVSRVLRARSREFRGKIQDFLENNNVRLFEKNREISHGFFLEIMSAFGAEDKKATMHKLHEGKFHWVRKDHRPPSGRTPYGYVFDDFDKKWSIVEREAKAIRWIAALAVGATETDFPLAMRNAVAKNPGGLPSRMIARLLNQESLTITDYYKRSGLRKLSRKNPEGAFSVEFVNTILRRDSYGTGMIPYEFKDTKSVGRRLAHHRPTIRTVEVPVPPILSPEVYAKIRGARSSRAVKATRNLKHDYLLKDVLCCEKCGVTLYARLKVKSYTRKSDGQRVDCTPTAYYQCARKIPADGSRCSATNYHNARLVEAAVWEKTREILLTPEMLQALVAAESVSDGSRITLAQVEKEISVKAVQKSKLEKEKQHLVHLLVKKVLNEDDAIPEKERLDRELKSVQKNLLWLESERERLQKIEDSYELPDVSGLAEKYAERLEALSFQERRFLVTTLFERIQVSAAGELRLVVKRLPREQVGAMVRGA